MCRIFKKIDTNRERETPINKTMEDYALAFFILILLVGVVGLIGNFVVVIVYLYDKSLRSFTKYFFVNLSIVDMLIILICLPVGLLDLANEGIWILGQRICETHSFIENTLVCVSSLTLISISLERYIAISRPFKVSFHVLFYYFFV